MRAALRAALPYALAGWISPADPHFEALAEDTAQETLLRVLAHLDSFEGRSRFTTWAQKIAVRVALTELRRRRWKDVSLDEIMESDEGVVNVTLMADPTPNPASAVEQADMLRLLQRIMAEELTEKQMRAMEAAAIRDMPLDEVARRMEMERNALYKLLHDARLKLKRRLAREGIPATGKRIAVAGMAVDRLQEGKVVEHWAYCGERYAE